MIKIHPSKILPFFLRYGIAIIFFVTIIGITILTNFETIREPYTWDENLYKNVSNNFSVSHIQFLYNNVMETKPLTFLVLQKVLNDADPSYTRTLNLFLIIISTILIYKITNNKLSFIYILIPIFLDSMWLTAEIIEITLVLISIQYVKYSGIFIGLATIFRPTALLYSILLKKIQILYVLFIGTIFALVLLYLGLFFPYLYEVTNYVGDTFYGAYSFVIIMLILLIVMGYNKRMLPYILISSIPFTIKMFPHYFLPIYTFLFVGFLLNINEDIEYYNILL